MIVHTGIPKRRKHRNKYVSGAEARKFLQPQAVTAEYIKQNKLTDRLTTESTRRGDTSQYPSNTDYLHGDEPVVCAPKGKSIYSGEALLGIATMHKSNAVPVTRAQGGIGTNPKITT